MEITLRVNKGDVMTAVGDITSYAGAKMGSDGEAYDRISTVDEDEEHLELFWDESRGALCSELIEHARGEAINASGEYELRLRVSNRHPECLRESMEQTLHDYFVASITGRWYVYVNKEEAVGYANKAMALLEELHRKTVYKSAPVRPQYED